MLIAAAITIILIGLVHSFLGESKVIKPLQNAKSLTPNHRRLIRVSWHVLTVFWFAIAIYLMVLQVRPGSERTSFLIIMASLFGLMTMLALIASKGRHFSYIGFGAVTILLSLSLSS